MLKKSFIGHFLAFFTIVIWGTTFVSTKVLLQSFTPIEILFFRFFIGFVVLLVIYPKNLKIVDWKQEGYFALAGLCGITLYFLFENIALTYTQASNVGVLVAIIPFFTALFSRWLLEEESLSINFFIGFVIAIAGICLITFNGNFVLKLNPLGDLFAIMASIVWALYSIVTKKISKYPYHIIQTTRRTFFYGILFLVPIMITFRFNLGLYRFSKPTNSINLLFLGVLASAICFLTWNHAVKVLGAVKTSVYIYIVPVVTVVTAKFVLNEKITQTALFGTFFIIIGLVISESKLKIRDRKVLVLKKRES